jgi:hypothetical protein
LVIERRSNPITHLLKNAEIAITDRVTYDFSSVVFKLPFHRPDAGDSDRSLLPPWPPGPLVQNHQTTQVLKLFE